MQIIARIHSPFTQKFGIPRQGSLAQHLKSTLVFEPAFRQRESLRGMENFSHLWLIWQFHLNAAQDADNWQATVRPPRLGGNERMGVFATRSPFRPNGLGLSVVKIEALHLEASDGGFIELSGADLVDGTPIYDIKPYLPYADSIPDARGGFATTDPRPRLRVEYAPELSLPSEVSGSWLQGLHECLALDPRPAYHDDPQRVYHMILQPYEVSFRVDGLVLTLTAIRKASA